MKTPRPLVPRSRRTTRALAVATLVGAALLVFALPADAHVTVGADDATRGAADSILTFRVPNEEDTAVTVKVTFSFPTKNPIPSVKASPKAGWTVTTRTVTFNPPIKTDDGTLTSGVGEVTYTAKTTADGIPVGQFESFQVLVGPLPDAAQVAFPTLQTYSDGKTVSWIQPVTDPANPPDNPAPVLQLSAAGATGSGTPAATTDPATAAGGAPAGADLAGYATTSDADTGRTLGIVGVVLGVLGLATGALAVARTRRPPAGRAAEPVEAAASTGD